MSKHPVRRLAAALVALAVVVPVSACGDDGPDEGVGTEVSSTEHNDADVAFATDMIQHHAQALAMVDMTMGRELDPEVVTLTEDIRAAQGPEIETMVDWLTEWGEEIPETMRDHTNAGHGHEHGEMVDSMEGMDTDMPGMMSAEDMDALEHASDAEFQDMWLTMMIEHHEGAVEMAETERSEGRYAPAVDLAGDIAESQTAEIEQMEQLLS